MADVPSRVAELVETMLDLHKNLIAAKVPDNKTRIQWQIDNLVYQLYDLTEEEIKIVEGTV